MPQNSQGSRPARPLISIVFPVWNEEENIHLLYSQVREALQQAKTDYEMIFVDNGSTDRSLALVKDLTENDSQVQYISLSRNFGHQGGLFAGLFQSRGDAVIMMDADLQHPPSLLPEMIRLWRAGNDVVYTRKRNYGISGLRRWQVKTFYWLLSKLSALKLSFGQSDFRLIDRKVVHILMQIPEYRKFLRGLVEWVGFRQAGIDYAVPERYAGRSKFSYRALVSFALDGILAFSFVPLRWSLFAGVTVAFFCLIYALYAATLGVLTIYLGFNFQLPPGWATLTAAIMFLASIQLIAIGVLSEYVGRIYEQTKGRPVFIVKESSYQEAQWSRQSSSVAAREVASVL